MSEHDGLFDSDSYFTFLSVSVYTAGETAGIVIVPLLVVGVLAVLISMGYITMKFNKGEFNTNFNCFVSI